MLKFILIGIFHISVGIFDDVDSNTNASFRMSEHIQSLSRNILLKGLGKFAEREQTYSEHRSNVRFVQYNQLSQDLAFDARLMETIRELTREGQEYIDDDDDDDDYVDDYDDGDDYNDIELAENVAIAKQLLEETDYFRVGNNFGSSCGSQEISCSDDIYRSIDGTCNNLKHSKWGASGRELLRPKPNTYADGKSEPRGGIASTLPSPRTVSSALHHEIPHPNNINMEDRTPHQSATHMMMQFGHFLGHDITLSSQEELDCCHPNIIKQEEKTPQSLKRCFNIDISDDDFYNKAGRSCHSFTRSDSRCSLSKVREQFNSISSYIDASNVYGADEATSRKLRSGRDGKLRINNRMSRPSLPTRSQCGFSSSPPEKPSDLVAGDERAIVQPGLTAVHTLFMREHNRIADVLAVKMKKKLSGKSSREKDSILFEETRRIVIAEIQNIVYDEYLPSLLGEETMERLSLDLDRGTNYNENLDPSIMNEFATAAMRFGHSTVSGLFKPIGHQKWPLKFHYFDFKDFVLGKDGSAFENELLGMAHQPSQKADLVATDDMTDFLFFDKSSGSKVGDDIMARNIQRGRDHGIPTYNTMRQACKVSKLTSFRSRPREIGDQDWKKMSEVYESVNDIDLITGGLAEAPVPGGLIGPTFACIIGKQFHALLFGDRYFFTHSSGEKHKGMSLELKNLLRKRTLRDIICENTNIRSLQVNVLVRALRNNPEELCSKTNDLDFDIIVDNLAIDGLIQEPEPIKPNPQPEPEPEVIIPQPDPKPKPVKPQPQPIKPVKPQPEPIKPKPQPIEPIKPKPQPIEPIKPKPQPIKPVEPKPQPIEPVKPKPQPIKPVKPKPQPIPVKPDPQPIKPVEPKPQPIETGKCVKDKLSFCQWLIPKCGTSEKTRQDCCKSCGRRHGL